MPRFATALLICVVATCVHANELFHVDVRIKVNRAARGSLQVVSAVATFDGQSLSLIATASGKPLVPFAMSVSVDKHVVQVEPTLLARVADPRFSDITVIADSGVMGTFFYWDIPFGAKKACQVEGRHINERMSAMITVTAEGAIERASIYDPCGASPVAEP